METGEILDMHIQKLDNTSNLAKLAIVGALILFAVMSRLVDHPANFTGIAAAAIFGGAILPKRWALTLPILAMIASDLIIGLHPLIIYTWGSFVLIALLSYRYLKNISPGSVVVASLSASILFYVVTNFGVWAEGRMYAMSLQGLIQCYSNAIPFFRNTLAGDLVFTSLLFVMYAFASSFAGNIAVAKIKIVSQ